MKKITLSLMLLAGSFFAFNAIAADDFSKGTDYHLLFLDEETKLTINPSAIAQDYRPDDTNHFLYVWDNTYTGLTASGPNWNGVVGEFLTFEVGTAGWSGLGFASAAGSPKDMSAITSDFTFHIAFKATNNASHLLIFDGAEGIGAKVCVGPTAFVDNNVTYEPVADFARDGQWHLVEIPVSDLFALGLSYPAPFAGNVFALLSGGVTGTKIDMDAIFFYKKTGVGVNEVGADKLDVFVSNNVITVPGATDVVELYTTTGLKVKSSQEGIIAVDDLNAGIYIVRCGGASAKVQVK